MPISPISAISLAPADDGSGFKLNINRLDFQANKEEFERQFLISALRTFKGRINQTALHANIPKKTLLRKLEKYGINAREYS
jgi:DNA-binding NtrC family response regulator